MLPVPIIPAGEEPQPRASLFANLRRIDGWGPGAWREVFGLWRLSTGILAINDSAGEGQADDGQADLILVLPGHRLLPVRHANDKALTTATTDWVLRRAWRTLIADATVRVSTCQPGSTVRASNACWIEQSGSPEVRKSGSRNASHLITLETSGTPQSCSSRDFRTSLHLRLQVDLPFAGMCCDSLRFARFLRRLERFAADLCRPARRRDLALHQQSVQRSRALRDALPRHGLVAFLGAGALLARAADGSALPGCAPLVVPRGHGVTMDLGRWGRVHGLGIRRGVTAVAGAPYHGKSTLLSALMAGREDHPPGDGRELVVSDGSAIRIQAEDGRRIKTTDLSWFFPQLPGSRAQVFATDHASGATSMAAGVVQGVAAGSRLLLVDEDSAAGNFLHLDAGMRALLGRDLAGHRTLVDALPGLAAQGVSTVLVAGAHLATLAAAQRVVVMRHFQPQDGTRQVRRLVRATGIQRAVSASASPRMQRVLDDDPDCLLGPRHFLPIDATEPERPQVGAITLDLRRSGWILDAALVRGAWAAAAWCCRLAGGRALDLENLRQRFADFIRERGARGLDPFDTQLLTVPPWSLVAAVLERLPRPLITMGTEPQISA